MRVLLDTNIIIHREASSVVNDEIGVLFKWLDNLHYKKCIHPITIEEIQKYKDPKTLKTMSVKLGNYNQLKTVAPLSPELRDELSGIDINENDYNDTLLLNELFCDRVDILITEDRKLIHKASLLNLSERVYTIDAFLEKVTADNPELVDYKVLSVRKEAFGNIDINDAFFDSFKEDYDGFTKWFNKKSEDFAYICKSDDQIIAFLYVKLENEKEDYSDIVPTFARKKRLKVGTFKVTLNGYKLGERFIKIIFDNAIQYQVEEIYITVFNNAINQQRLINLLEDFGFSFYGHKVSSSGKELVYVRNFNRSFNPDLPKLTYPYISTTQGIFLVSIYPEYHTNLFPDSILNTESPEDFTENEPYRNAISKVFISRSFNRNLKTGDLIIFYRTGGLYKGVITTIGVVENTEEEIKNEKQFIDLCRKRSVFTDAELCSHWNYRATKPFIVNFLYTYSLPKRLNLRKLIDLGIVTDVASAPRGFERISRDDFIIIAREAQIDERIIVN